MRQGPGYGHLRILNKIKSERRADRDKFLVIEDVRWDRAHALSNMPNSNMPYRPHAIAPNFKLYRADR